MKDQHGIFIFWQNNVIFPPETYTFKRVVQVDNFRVLSLLIVEVCGGPNADANSTLFFLVVGVVAFVLVLLDDGLLRGVPVDDVEAVPFVARHLLNKLIT